MLMTAAWNRAACLMKLLSRDRIFLLSKMAALAAALSSVALPAMAQAIITQQTPLTFGRIAVAGSGGERTIVMEPDGDIILVDPGIYIIIPPEPGEYTVTGDPNTEYAIS